MSDTENASGTQVPCISLLACPFCGHEAIASVTGKFARCGNEECFLGQPDFFLDATKWNTRANNKNRSN
jgi:hypothetical protein